MTEYLFLGGPLHGQVKDVDPGRDVVTVPRPVGFGLEQDQSGVPILSAASVVNYRLQKMGSPSGHFRRVFVEASMPPQIALQALADVLIALWIESGDVETDAQPESAPEPGPAATL